jgi:hypothetical protein
MDKAERIGDTNDPTIDTQLYLRDGAPAATVCKVQMKDGRIGIGVYRLPPGTSPRRQDELDALALGDAITNLGPLPAPEYQEEPDDDLQAKLGHPAHDE